MKSMYDNHQVKIQPWEKDFHNALLTPLLLLALSNGPKDMTVISYFIDEITEFKVKFNDLSMYRALRRLSEAGLIEVTLHNQTWRPPTPLLPPIPHAKIYTLTKTGSNQLGNFLSSSLDILKSIVKVGKILGAD